MNTQSIALITLFAALTGVGGWIRIPTPVVPVTLQTFFVYLAGDLLGPRRAAWSQLVFLALGLLGVPIFAEGGGLGYVLRPTFGYLASFPAAAWITGKLSEKISRTDQWQSWIAANAAGSVLIFGVGVFYLLFSVNTFLGKEMSFIQAVWSGCILFVPGELVKIVLAAWLARRLKSLVERSVLC